MGGVEELGKEGIGNEVVGKWQKYKKTTQIV